MLTFSIVIIALALIFDFINGFHDAANAIATIVATKVLSPFMAVLWAAFFNFLAFFAFSDHNVADTIAKTVRQEYVTHTVIFSGLVGAILWNLLTWWRGIPSSSSHALIGGFAGAALVHSMTFDSIETLKIVEIVIFIVLAPLIGLIVGMFITLLISARNLWLKAGIVAVLTSTAFYFVRFNIYWKISILAILLLFGISEAYLYFSKSSYSVYNRFFRRLQLLSSAAFSLGHGGNDAQKVMGIIAVTLIIDGQLDTVKNMPTWVPLACYTAISLGTLSGGWRIVKTMGTKITKVTPLEGVASETAGAMTLFATESLGVPVSTTHTITGSIMGVGLAHRVSAVRWGVTRTLVRAWIITIPITAFIAGITYFIVRYFM